MAQTRPKAPALKQPSQSEKPSANRELQIKRLLVIGAVVVIVLAIAVIAGLLILNALSGSRHESVAVAPGLNAATFATVPGDSAFPIGIARTPDGTIYLSALGTDVIYKVAADGSLTPWLKSGAGLNAPAALATAPDGSLYVLDFTSPNPIGSIGSIKRITADGKVSVFANQASTYADGLSFVSQVAFDHQGNLYVTLNRNRGEIWRFSADGAGTLWLKLDPVGNTSAQPTGIAYDQANNALAVADGATGSIYRVAINSDGSAGRPLVLYREADLAFQGLAFDNSGRLLVLAWQHDNGQLAQLTSDGKYVLLAQSFRGPSALLPVDNKVYVVNSDLTGIVPFLHPKPPFTVDVVSGFTSVAGNASF